MQNVPVPDWQKVRNAKNMITRGTGRSASSGWARRRFASDTGRFAALRFLEGRGSGKRRSAALVGILSR